MLFYFHLGYKITLKIFLLPDIIIMCIIKKGEAEETVSVIINNSLLLKQQVSSISLKNEK